MLGAAIAGTNPLKDKLGIVSDGTHIVGFADWAEQLIAESTGKEGTGLLPVVLDKLAPELESKPADLQVVRLVANAEAHHLFPADRHEGEILVSGSLGAQLIVWEYAVAVAGRLLGINPFDQPDVEAAKVAARSLLDNRPEPVTPAFTAGGIEVRTTGSFLGSATTLDAAVDALLAQLGPDGYVAVQAYVDRIALPQLAGIRDLLAAKAGRPVTFGWGPRFLHSTGQFHKGGPAVGVFLQITGDAVRGPRDPRPSLHLRAAHPGPGRRRRERPRRARPPGADPDAHEPRGGCRLAVRGRQLSPIKETSHLSPVEITPEFNPLRLPSDRRLNRIAGPSSLIIFGVTGDLSRKKLMPAVYDLANRGLLPPGFSLVGFARRDWEDQDFEKVVYDAVKQYARTPFDDDVWQQLAQGIRFVPGEFDDDEAFQRLKQTVEELDVGTRHDGQPRVLPVHPAEGLPDRHRAAEALRPGRPVRRAAGAASSSRSRSGTTCSRRAS